MIGEGLIGRLRHAVIDGTSLAGWPLCATSMCGDGGILGIVRRVVKSPFNGFSSNFLRHGE